MQRARQYVTRTHRTALALSLAAATTGAIALANTDAFVEQGFTTALEKNARPQASARTAATTAPVSGTEDFWLRQARSDVQATREVKLASWPAPVSEGATIKLAIAGRETTLEVVEIADLPPGATRIDNAGAEKPLVVVTCRDAANPDAGLIRLVVEGEAVTRQLAPIKQARAL